MQPLRRAFIASLRPSKSIASQCLTTTTSNTPLTSSSLYRHSRLLSLSSRAPVLRTHPFLAPNSTPTSVRSLSSSAAHRKEQIAPSDGQAEVASRHPGSEEAVEEADVKRPSYEMVFTCKPCGERSMHTVSKQGYHHGTVLVACPGCKARHLIADHLKIFGDKARSLEQLLKENGEILKKGHINAEGDVEIWPEGEIDAGPAGTPEGKVSE